MKKGCAVLFVLFITLDGVGAGARGKTIDSVPKPVRFCESRIMEKLGPHRSYQRIGYEYHTVHHKFHEGSYIDDLTNVDRYDWTSDIIRYNKKSDIEHIKHMSSAEKGSYIKKGFINVTIVINFYAYNSHGALVRSTAFCDWVKIGRNPKDISWLRFDADRAGLIIDTK